METINLFTGNLRDLSGRLQSIPVNERYLKFAGENSFPSMLTKMEEGCPVMAAKYTAQAQSTPFASTKGYEYQYSTEGQFYDVATFLSGEPEYWLNEVEAAGTTTPKDFYINIAAPYWVTEKDIFTKLIKVVEIIDTMEAAGQRLNIILCLTDKAREPQYRNDEAGPFNPLTAYITIKTAGEPVNIQQLVYLVASPVLLRYAFLTMQKAAGYDYNPISCTATETVKLEEVNTFYIPSISFDYVEDKVKYSVKKNKRTHEITGTIDYTNADLTKIYNLK